MELKLVYRNKRDEVIQGGRHGPANLNEKLAMEEAMTNPEIGRELKGLNTDFGGTQKKVGKSDRKMLMVMKFIRSITY